MWLCVAVEGPASCRACTWLAESARARDGIAGNFPWAMNRKDAMRYMYMYVVRYSELVLVEIDPPLLLSAVLLGVCTCTVMAAQAALNLQARLVERDLALGRGVHLNEYRCTIISERRVRPRVAFAITLFGRINLRSRY